MEIINLVEKAQTGRLGEIALVTEEPPNKEERLQKHRKETRAKIGQKTPGELNRRKSRACFRLSRDILKMLVRFLSGHCRNTLEGLQILLKNGISHLKRSMRHQITTLVQYN